MVLSTLYGEGRALLAINNYQQLRCFPGLVQFFALFVLFRKTVVSTHKTVHNKAPGQVLPYSDNTLFGNKVANSGHSRTAQPNCSDIRFIEKTNRYHTSVLFWNTARDDLSHLPLGNPPCRII